MIFFTIIGMLVVLYLALGTVWTGALIAVDAHGIRKDIKKEPLALLIMIAMWPASLYWTFHD